MGDLGIDQVLTMLIQEDPEQEQEIRRDRQRSLLMPKPLALAAPRLDRRSPALQSSAIGASRVRATTSAMARRGVRDE
jgi:hypothetical protein